MKRSRLFLLFSFLTGCAGLIGVPDLDFVDSPADAGPDGNVVVDANPVDANRPDTSVPFTDGGTDARVDATVDAATCDLSVIATDPLNCGRCGHSCLGGTCSAGMCQAVPLTTVGGATFRFIVEHGDFVYASTFWRGFGDQPGIYRISKANGARTKFIDRTYVDQLVVSGNTLYYTDTDYAFNDAGRTGGIWSCPLDGTTVCTPKLLEISDEPHAIALDRGTLYWGEPKQDRLRALEIDAGFFPGSPDAATRSLGGVESSTFAYYLWAGGDIFSLGGFNAKAYVSRHPVDGGAPEELSRYAATDPNPGSITGNATAIFFAAHDFETTTGGIVRRVRRPDAPLTQTTCSYGDAIENVRPAGVYIDGTSIFWTNLGDFASPYARGSIATCPQEGACCTTPTILWRGAGEPAGITGDANALYWVTYRTGDVYKMAKP